MDETKPVFIVNGAEPKLKFFTRVEKHEDGYMGTVSVEHGAIGLFVTELRHSRRSLDCVIEIDVPEQSAVAAPFRCRIDLRSNSAIKNLVSSLNNAFGGKKDKDGYNWERILNGFTAELSDRLHEEQRSIDVSTIAFSEPQFLLRPFLQKDSSNLVFAQSEVGKSWFALRMAVSLITGKDFLGNTVDGGKRVLYLDYEDSEDAYASRLHKICRGMGVEFVDVAPNARYYKPTGSFVDNVAIIKHEVITQNIDLIIIDAGGDATGGSPSDEQKVLDFFNALEEVRVTKLILHHEPKNVINESAAFYGSMYWKARSRVGWRLETESQDGATTIVKASIQKRSNLPYYDPFYYQISFDALALEDFESGVAIPAVTLDRKDANDFKSQSVDDQIIEMLGKEPSGVSVTDIASTLGVSKQYLHKLADGKLRRIISKKIDGKTAIFRLKSAKIG